MADKLTLYGYFRSSAAYRVRIALHLKGLAHEQRFVHLVRNGGEQHQEAYRLLNPQGLVPTLTSGDEPISQSIAICEYLEETHPAPPLLPPDPLARAYVRSIMGIIACDMHPLNNLRVLNYLTDEIGLSEDGKSAWYRHWVELGLAALESIITRRNNAGLCCHGEQPTLADAFLIPQIYNAKRFHIPLEAYPRLCAIDDHCNALPAFQEAHPSAQLDAS